jgi:hypothetical protein
MQLPVHHVLVRVHHFTNDHFHPSNPNIKPINIKPMNSSITLSCVRTAEDKELDQEASTDIRKKSFAETIQRAKTL